MASAGPLRSSAMSRAAAWTACRSTFVSAIARARSSPTCQKEVSNSLYLRSLAPPSGNRLEMQPLGRADLPSLEGSKRWGEGLIARLT